MSSRARPRTSMFRRALLLAWAVLAFSPPTNAAEVAQPARVSVRRAEREQQRLLAGHLLRRIGFGPDRREMRDVLRRGIDSYVERQLHPESIDDRVGESRFRRERAPEETSDHGLRWLTRMAFSRASSGEARSAWHEHFRDIGGESRLVQSHARSGGALPPRGLGSFRDSARRGDRDSAMLIYLDNSYNDGAAVDPKALDPAKRELRARAVRSSRSDRIA